MKREFIVSVAILTLLSILCACSNKKAIIDKRCPALVEKAEYYNAQTANGTKEGPMGMRMSVQVFRHPLVRKGTTTDRWLTIALHSSML